MDRLSIGKLARAANVSADTVRYYERMGLLTPPERAKSGYRAYGEADLRRLLAIRRARAVGFSIHEIAELLAVRPEADTSQARALLEKKLAAIDLRLAELNQWRAAIIELMTGGAACLSLESMLAGSPKLDDLSTDEPGADP